MFRHMVAMNWKTLCTFVVRCDNSAAIWSTTRNGCINWHRLGLQA